MYDTRFKGSFKAVPICVYKPCSIRKRTLGLISCNTTTSRSLRPIPLNWVPLEFLQYSDSSSATIAPHWSSSYPKYLSADQDKEEQQRIVWSRIHDHRANLAKRLLSTRERYLAARQELNPKLTQVESSHGPLFRDIKSNLTMVSRTEKVFKAGVSLNWRGERNIVMPQRGTLVRRVQQIQDRERMSLV